MTFRSAQKVCRFSSLPLAIATILGVVESARSQDWPQWRGPLGQGITTAQNPLPVAGAETLEVLWKTPIPGEGCSSPIVSNGHVYLTTAYEGSEGRAWDWLALWGSVLLAGAAAGLALRELPGLWRSFSSRPILMTVLCTWTLAVVLLIAALLAKPRWFWQFADSWTGTTLAVAELPWVESWNLRPLIVLVSGSLVLIFLTLWGTDRDQPQGQPKPPILQAWLSFVSLVVVSVGCPLLALIAWRPEWFGNSSQPWLAWLVTGGLGLFVFAASLGSTRGNRTEANFAVSRFLALVIGFSLAGWLFSNTPDDEFGHPLSLLNRIAYLVPGVMLFSFHSCVCIDCYVKQRLWPGLAKPAELAKDQNPSPGRTCEPLQGQALPRPANPAEATTIQSPSPGGARKSEQGQPGLGAGLEMVKATLPAAATRPFRLFTFSPLHLFTLILTTIVFIRANYWQPQTGVVRAVLCLDARSGQILWNTPVYFAADEKRHSLNSLATPTPACDDERIYAWFGSGLAALDLDGRVLWLKRDEEFAGFIRYGAGSSIALAGDRIILFRDSEFVGDGDHLDDDISGQKSRRSSALTALDKRTGDVIWSITPPFSHDSYMTPLVWSRDKELEVVIATWKTLAAFAAQDGSLRWTHFYPMQQIVPSLAVDGDTLIVTGGNSLPSPILAVQAPSSAADQQAAAHVLWFQRTSGGNIVSPVCWDGLLYSVGHDDILTCRDAQTGIIHWTTRLGSRFLASLVAGDGKLYALDQEGTLHVLAASPTLTELATLPLLENCSATPALAESAVFVRSAGHLYCIRDP